MELLVVVAILGVLAGLMLPVVQRARMAAQATERLNWKRQRLLDDPPPRTIPYRVLFIGNSHTSNGGIDIPEALAELSRLGGRADVRGTKVVVGGQTLEGHWATGTARDAIEQSTPEWFDFVVLQDQSQAPCAAAVSHQEFNERFGKLAKATQAIPLVYQLFQRAEGAPGVCPQETLTRASIDAVKLIQGDEGTGEICPVGEAWRTARARRPEVELHHADGNHANEAGGYLTACVFYAVIHRASPSGLPASISTPSGMLRVPPDDAAFLQTVAWETAEAWRRKTRPWFVRGDARR